MINIDLTTLSGYSTLTKGSTYSLTVKAKAQGYQDSDASAAVSYTVPQPQLAAPTITASDTTITWDAIENADSYDVYVDGELYENVTGGVTPKGETWLLKGIPLVSSKSYDNTFAISFTSNGNTYAALRLQGTSNTYIGGFNAIVLYDTTTVYDSADWVNESYRTITFNTAPTGDLLTWLEANGTKQ